MRGFWGRVAIWASPLAWALGGCAAEPDGLADGSGFSGVQPPIARRAPPRTSGRPAPTLALSADSREVPVPGLPAGHTAMNPGLALYQGRLVMVFRVNDHSGPGPWLRATRLGIMTLDETLTPHGEFSFLPTPHSPPAPEASEDPRLINHDGRLFVVYNASHVGVGVALRRIHVAEVLVDTSAPRWQFCLQHDKRLLARIPGRGPPLMEKNWSPFSYDGALHFIYQSSPTLMLRLGEAALQMPASDAVPEIVQPPSQVAIPWAFGEVRGGTQAIYDPGIDRYVTFFHSRHFGSINGGARRDHYFVGFYTFLPHPPFDIDGMYPAPLISEPFLEELEHTMTGTIVYVQGLVIGGDRYWVSYGRGDRALGMMSFDRQQLLAGLVNPAKTPLSTLPAEVAFEAGHQPIGALRVAP